MLPIALGLVSTLAAAFALRWATSRRRERLRVDVLKRFHQCERQGREVHVDALAGLLAVPIRRAQLTLDRLIAEGSVRADGPRLRLTATGRDAARALVRRHRLLETYLADLAGHGLGSLHRRADRLEHRVSDERLEAIDRSLGHPLRDPHGDPIPDGRHRGARPTVALDVCPAGAIVEVAHVEDEPESLYRELLGYGVTPGTALEVVANDDEGLRVAVAGHGEVRLRPPLASQVDVVPSETGREELRALVRLDDLDLGVPARVVMLTSDLRGEGRRRLLDLGFTPGAHVRPVLENALGDDPTAYLIRQTKIALRRELARHVLVTPLATPEGRRAA
jgi:DtxR family transcriptional regulator, Mn-dependent transcriptional regulator